MASNATCLGFPRMGPNRELKWALEKYWSKSTDADKLLDTAKALRTQSWSLQREKGLVSVPCNDFSLYDQVLDAAVLVGAVPPRFRPLLEADGSVGLTAYFAMARGFQDTAPSGERVDVSALQMVKWFDTNYHYLVPELEPGMSFRLHAEKPLAELNEAQALGVKPRVVLLGPVSFLLLSKWAPDVESSSKRSRLELLPPLLDVYAELVRALADASAAALQFDEPCVVTDPPDDADASAIADALARAYQRIDESLRGRGVESTICTYFDAPHEDLVDALVKLPVHGLHVDATRSTSEQLMDVARRVANASAGCGGGDGGTHVRSLGVGVVDGRNVWRVDAHSALEVLRELRKTAKVPLVVATSCSLLHSPYSLEPETEIRAEVREWLAFATDKLEECVRLSELLSAEEDETTEASPAAREWLNANARANEARRGSKLTRDSAVRERMAAVGDGMLRRHSNVAARAAAQREALRLPQYPTTTIGSFPQTAEVRRTRTAFRKGQLSSDQYERQMADFMRDCVRRQEALGLDVIVHGEFERTDMVEFFGERLEGFLVTRNGWVQSYGSRCVKPPILFGDVSRPRAMTVDVSRAAQALTGRPVKGMLTGPVTILQWSFVRDDQPRRHSCMQIALAIRDEVEDLQGKAGLRVVQVDEPAIREGLPLRQRRQTEYLGAAVDAFRLATAVARDDVQLHSHFCYSDFGSVLASIIALDADVLSIESARSSLSLLRALQDFDRATQIGPGVWDIHSPRVPGVDELLQRVRTIRKFLAPTQLWINPDCGLKTRAWAETERSIANLVHVAKLMREGEPAAAATQ